MGNEAMNNKQVYLAALAGLLHDVGKFAQRAGWQSGTHTEIGGEFVRQYVPEQWREHLYPVMGHHDKPLTGQATKVVALADRLSAGEREEKQTAQPKQLLSIFCRLESDGGKAPEERYWPLKPLALQDNVIFPGDEGDADYTDLWRGFEREAQLLHDAHTDGGDLAAYLESMLLLMRQYTWCIPSAYYRSVPDVSLYDHSRTTAALVACLHEVPETTLDALLKALADWHKARKEAERQGRDPKTVSPPAVLEQTETALLVGGDLSGAGRGGPYSGSGRSARPISTFSRASRPSAASSVSKPTTPSTSGNSTVKLLKARFTPKRMPRSSSTTRTLFPSGLTFLASSHSSRSLLLNLHCPPVVNHLNVRHNGAGYRQGQLVHYSPLNSRAHPRYSGHKTLEQTVRLVFHMIQTGHIDAGDSRHTMEQFLFFSLTASTLPLP